MSGPKYGEHRLSAKERARQEAERKKRIEAVERARQEAERQRRIEAERQRQIEEARRREEQECERLEEQIRAARETLTHHRRLIETFQDEMVERYRKTLGHTTNLQEFVEARRAMSQSVGAFPQDQGPRKSTTMSAYLQRLHTHLEQNRLERHPHLAQLANTCAREVGFQEFINAEAQYYQAVENMGKKVERFNLSRPTAAVPAVESQLETLLAEFHSAIEPLREALPDDEKLADLARSVADISTNARFDPQYKLEQVRLRLKGLYLEKTVYEVRIAEREKRQHELERLLSEHEALCAMLGLQPETGYEAMTPEVLEEQNTRLHNALREKEEREYISTALHEVMTELGHEVVADEIMETEKGPRHRSIYAMTEHTGINVYHSPGGAIMFEVCGYAADRQEIGELDRLRVRESMEDFCSEYEVIKEKLAARGIDVANENRKPPHEKYARFVDINAMTGRTKAERKRTAQQPGLRRMELE